MVRLTSLFPVCVALMALASCVDSIPQDDSARIFAMGDSMLSWGSGRGSSIPDELSDDLAEPVVSRARLGAQMISAQGAGSLGYNIPKQYAAGPWEWVVMSGGGNDLFFGCDCQDCDALLDRLISPQGTQGAIPSLISQVRSRGARVVYIGYLPSPGVASIADVCVDEAIVLEDRLMRLAATDNGMTYLSFASMVPFGDKSYHVGDVVHPSLKARKEIASQIADVIR